MAPPRGGLRAWIDDGTHEQADSGDDLNRGYGESRGEWVFQTDSEGEMCQRIHQAYKDKVDGVLINAGAWTHYSYAIRDALAILTVPVVELHMSNIHAREPFRKHSYFSDLAVGVIAGLGPVGYELALEAAIRALTSPA